MISVCRLIDAFQDCSLDHLITVSFLTHANRRVRLASHPTCFLWPKMLQKKLLWLTCSQSDPIFDWPRPLNSMNTAPQLPLVSRREPLGKYVLLLLMLSESVAAQEATRQRSCSDPSDAACTFNLGLFLFCSPSVSQLSDLIKPRPPQNSEEEDETSAEDK